MNLKPISFLILTLASIANTSLTYADETCPGTNSPDNLTSTWEWNGNPVTLPKGWAAPVELSSDSSVYSYAGLYSFTGAVIDQGIYDDRKEHEIACVYKNKDNKEFTLKKYGNFITPSQGLGLWGVDTYPKMCHWAHGYGSAFAEPIKVTDCPFTTLL